MDDGGGEPLAELGVAGAGGGEDGAVAAGDARFLTDGLDVAADGELFE